jgi:hypothetical protein
MAPSPPWVVIDQPRYGNDRYRIGGNRFPSWIFLPVEEISANHQPSLQLIETKDF